MKSSIVNIADELRYGKVTEDKAIEQLLEVFRNNGVFNIENRYHYTNLNQSEFEVEWIQYNSKGEALVMSNETIVLDMTPGQKGKLKIALPNNWNLNHTSDTTPSFSVLYIAIPALVPCSFTVPLNVSVGYLCMFL